MHRRSAVALIAGLMLSACLGGAAPPAGQGARLLSDIEWSMPQRAFGGFSGLEVSADGMRFTAISDRGHLVEGRFRRDAEGRISGIEAGALRPVLNAKGRRAVVTRRDTEGLARAADGTLYVSFEGRAQVARLGDDMRARPLPRAEAFDAIAGNGALEALAIDPAGRLFTLAERGPDRQPRPVWTWDGQTWTEAFRLRFDDGFSPVGADFGPDGKLYLLERSFTGLGFRSRLRRMTAEGREVEVLMQTPTGTHDNLEGLAVWQAADGGLRATMISDDNHRFFQRTEFVEYRLP